MAQIARKMVEKAGIDVDKLVDMLVKNASAELTTFYYYTILRVNLIGLEGEGGTSAYICTLPLNTVTHSDTGV